MPYATNSLKQEQVYSEKSSQKKDRTKRASRVRQKQG
jgi:hypothetical protein